MRTPTLQYLYLQKPVTMVVVICILSVLPWIGLGDYAAPWGEQATSGAISFAPPFAGWLSAVFSYPLGYVSLFTARFPSALAFTLLIGFILVFFGKRFRFQEAFIATLLLITSWEIHTQAMKAGPDMVLTAFVVIGLIQLYRWEEKLELKGLPVVIPILLGCAALTKGPVGIVLPLFVFAVYLVMLRRYRALIVFKSIAYAFISSLFLPALWYIAMWKAHGDAFLDNVWAENIARFFRFEVPGYAFTMEQGQNFFYNFGTLLAGFMPWTVFFVFTLFGLRIVWPHKNMAGILQSVKNGIFRLERPRLFSLVAIVCILVFYSFPAIKKSFYLLPAYPFIALFLAQYLIYITEYRTKVTRIFAAVIASVTALLLIGALLTMTGLVEPVRMAEQYTQDALLLARVDMVAQAVAHPSALTISLLLLLLVTLGTVYYQMRKKINIKILYATIALAFAFNLAVDGIVVRTIYSVPPADWIVQGEPANAADKE